MTSEPKPLIHDSSKPAYVRDLLQQARSAKGPPYDLQAGLAKHKALVASGAPLPEWAHSSLAEVLEGGSLMAKIGGLTSISVLVGGLVWGAWTLSGRPDTAEHQVRNARRENAQTVPSGRAAEENAGEAQQRSVGATALRSMPASGVPSRIDSQKGNSRAAQTRAVRAQPSAAPTKKDSRGSSQVGGNERSASGPLRPVQLPDKRPLAVVAAPASPEGAQQHQTSEASERPTALGLPAAAANAVEPSAAAPVQGAPAELASTERSSPDDHDVLQREMVLLAEARRRVDDRPARALALARAKQPKTGMLSEEWEQVRLLALLRLGRIEEVRQGARRFRRRYPTSAFNERIENELTGKRPH